VEQITNPRQQESMRYKRAQAEVSTSQERIRAVAGGNNLSYFTLVTL